ncbi:glycoside hydrolase family 2 protein [Persicobacter diffluens]|uniref:Beta-galactosidase n=1 Tax=Persicobacter diffluens TaxID=981 RepID=A0AAN4W139_9BACT|nr:beta-galactosidase [Persicobacter diffluens]
MKQKLLYWLCLFLYSAVSFAQLPEGYPDTHRTKENINLGWKFSKMEQGQQPVAIDFDDTQWEAVSLPHNPDPMSLLLDSATEVWTQEIFIRDLSWYRKQMKIDLASDEKAFLVFEGVHNATELWVNGKKVGRYAVNGYIPHHFDITDFINAGAVNTIAVLADNTFNPAIAPDPDQSDYLKWGGIYRDVYLVKTHQLHVNFNWEDFEAGVHITTPTVKKNNGTVSIKTTVVNEADRPANCRIETKIINAEGLVIQKLQADQTIGKGLSHTFRQSTAITEDYHLWSPDHPYLYRVISTIYSGDQPVDFVENRFGFRSLELVDGQGFLLNGEPFFMIGVNRHQSFPHIGDAVPNSMHYEAALRYKEAGINTIRLSHYPQDDSFIEACDELGILLYEEPSTWLLWRQGDWMNTLEQSLRVMVRHHRNHPSIVIWGAGINHRGPVPQLNSAAKEEDPFRLTASASSPWCGIVNAGVTDIYATMDYRKTDWPERDFCMVMEHGYSHNGLAEQHHISRYKKRKNNIGALLWVGADYNRLQPKTDPENLITYYGLMTGYRVPRPAYFWYQSENVAQAFVHIADASVYKNQKVHVYSNAPKVAFYADGELVAIQSADNDPLRNNNEHPSFTFRYMWTDQQLTAKALIRETVVAEHSRHKEGAPYAIKLMVDYPQIPLIAGGSDLKMIRAVIVDKNGETVTASTDKVHFEVKGAGEIVYADKEYVDQMQVQHGVATIYLKGTGEAGEIELKATAGKLKAGKLKLQSTAFVSDELAGATPVYDFPNHKIDLQTAGQLEQFGWEIVEGEEGTPLSFERAGATFQFSADQPVKWRKGTYAIKGDLPFMACDGFYTEEGTVNLKIEGLAAGTYVLKTYHHSFQNLAKLYPFNIKVEQQDANGAFVFESDDEAVGVQDSKNTGERKPASVSCYIESDDQNPISISYKINKENAHTWINGLEFKRIK